MKTMSSLLTVGSFLGALGLALLLACCRKEQAGLPGPEQGRSGWRKARVVASGLDHPKGVVAADGEAYVVTGGFPEAENGVVRISLGTGVVERLARVDEVVAGVLAVDEREVFFATSGAGAILAVSRQGGPVRTVTSATMTADLALDPTHVYFLSFAKSAAGGTLQRVARTGGPAEVLLSGHPGMDQLVVDGASAFFRSNRGIYSVPKGGGEGRCLLPAHPGKNVDRLAGDPTHLYFFQETARAGRYAVARIPKEGGPPETIGPVADPTGHLALSETHVYFFREASLTDNALARVPKGGGEAELVDGAGYGTGYLTVAGNQLLFTDISSLRSVPR